MRLNRLFLSAAAFAALTNGSAVAEERCLSRAMLYAIEKTTERFESLTSCIIIELTRNSQAALPPAVLVAPSLAPPEVPLSPPGRQFMPVPLEIFLALVNGGIVVIDDSVGELRLAPNYQAPVTLGPIIMPGGLLRDPSLRYNRMVEGLGITLQ